MEPSPQPSPEPCGTFLEPSPEPSLHQSLPDLLRNLLRNPVEPDLALHQSLPDLLRNLTSLNLTRRLHQCTPELFWAEDPISLRCWGKTLCQSNDSSKGTGCWQTPSLVASSAEELPATGASTISNRKMSQSLLTHLQKHRQRAPGHSKTAIPTLQCKNVRQLRPRNTSVCSGGKDQHLPS